MKQLILLAATLLYMQSYGQPVIPASSIPSVGTSWVQTVTESTPSPGPAGANQSWDFSTTPLDGFSFEANFVDPSTTPYSATFPGASLAGDYLIEFDTISESFYEYYQVQGGTFSVLGEASSFTTTIYSDPQELPYVNLTFGTTVMDDYISTTTTMLGEITTYGMTSHHYDGYGSINLPQGMINEVIRIHEFDISVDTSDLGYGTTIITRDTSEIYSWIQPSSILPVATWESSRGRVQTYFNGMLINDQSDGPDVTFSITEQGMSSVEPGPVSATDEIRLHYDVSVHQLHIYFEEEIAPEHFEVYTSAGKRIYQLATGELKSQHFYLDLAHVIVPGVFYLTVNNNASKKFFVPNR